MTIAKLHTMDFEDAVCELAEEVDCITTYDTLIDFAKFKIDSQDIFVAIHILEALWNSSPLSDWYDYDYSMGTLDKPTSICTIEDLEDYCEEAQ